MAKIRVRLGAAAGLLAMGIACTAAAHAQPQPAARPESPPQSAAAKAAPAARGASHYIEFRVAQIGTYGHSYVVYGRLNARGEPAERNYADRYPEGTYLHMAVGHLLPVPANKEWNPAVLSLPVATSFRRTLSEAEYRKLVAAVRRARASTQYWNALTNNCNHFVAELATAIGMKVPAGLQIAYSFIPALRDLNQRAPEKLSEASR
jgi:hypothetical protein